MRIAIISAANIIHTPYLEYYANIFDEIGIEYDIITWNKMGIDESEDISTNLFSYDFKFDSNSCKLKKFIGYYRYKIFVSKILDIRNYDKLIVLTAQSGVFLTKYLKSKYRGKYILDIRDYANAKFYMNKLKTLVEFSYFTAISSPGYKEWLPNIDKYVISHNIAEAKLKYMEKIRGCTDVRDKDVLEISTIGVIRDYATNVAIINEFSNSKNYIMKYHGRGLCEKDLINYCEKNNIKNIKFEGQYKRESEADLYLNSDIINSYMGYEENVTRLISNRLYNSTIFAKPIIVSKGSYMANIVKKYKLGLVVDLDNEDLKDSMNRFKKEFNPDEYLIGRYDFLNTVKDDFCVFKQNILKFIES